MMAGLPDSLVMLTKVSFILLDVHYKNAIAIPFYYKQGFRLSKVKMNDFGEGHDSIELKYDF